MSAGRRWEDEPEALVALRQRWADDGWPAGGVYYLTPQTIAQDFLEELQAHIALGLHVPWSTCRSVLRSKRSGSSRT